LHRGPAPLRGPGLARLRIRLETPPGQESSLRHLGLFPRPPVRQSARHPGDADGVGGGRALRLEWRHPDLQSYRGKGSSDMRPVPEDPRQGCGDSRSWRDLLVSRSFRTRLTRYAVTPSPVIPRCLQLFLGPAPRCPPGRRKARPDVSASGISPWQFGGIARFDAHDGCVMLTVGCGEVGGLCRHGAAHGYSSLAG
jgi:hypothetical protein